MAKHSIQNDLVGAVSDFSLPQSYTNVPPLLKKCKEYSYVLPIINIPEKYTMWNNIKRSSKWGNYLNQKFSVS